MSVTSTDYDRNAYQASMLGMALTLSTERRALPEKWAQIIASMDPSVAAQLTSDLDAYDAQVSAMRGNRDRAPGEVSQ